MMKFATVFHRPYDGFRWQPPQSGAWAGRSGICSLRPGQDGSAGCRQLGQVAPGRRADSGVGSRCRTRGDARSGAGAARRGAQPAPGPPAALGVSVAPRRSLRAAGLDQAASPVARRAQIRAAVRHLVLEDYIQAVEIAEARRDRLTAQIAAMLPDWTLAPVAPALQTMRGMALVNAPQP
jgi:hypothetical protein